ncbi:S-adenosyl-L-methionine-dependent methyltransferase [Gigaspora rosea]|uniref:peptide chain release factor N(5)-glutamine methyltransferase n=1 Tax=Gigaspora rosea TaxID=44941 RepID=A0A397W0C4_9GLOM|nr:S-adenosyl-L-methionine-dependent methyltransferase [Gigaspora rosea]
MQTFLNRLLTKTSNDLSQAQQELKWLTIHVLQQTKNPILNKLKTSMISTNEIIKNLNNNEKIILNKYVSERVEKSKPLQYILGTQPFCDLEIITKPPVLIPRWETEEWTGRLIALLKPLFSTTANLASQKFPFKIIDICTGSGCIALSLSNALPQNSCYINGVDISNDALSLANLNLSAMRSCKKLHNQVEFFHLDIMKSTDKQICEFMRKSNGYDLVVSNPPYISHDEYLTLDEDVKLWEDKLALVADENGTIFHSKIAYLAAKYLLKKNSHFPNVRKNKIPDLVMEIGGSHQVSKIVEELKKYNFKSVDIWKDGANKDRCIVANLNN